MNKSEGCDVGFKNWVEVTIPMSSDEVQLFFGQRCATYDPLCACCIAWRDFDHNNMVTVVVTRDDIINILREEGPAATLGKEHSKGQIIGCQKSQTIPSKK